MFLLASLCRRAGQVSISYRSKMEALIATYRCDASSYSDSEDSSPPSLSVKSKPQTEEVLRHTRSLDSLQAGQSSRVRSFPHVEGNYALHVYIPVPMYKFAFDVTLYGDPKPHISLAWALGDISSSLKKVVQEETKSSGFSGSLQSSICTSKFIGIKYTADPSLAPTPEGPAELEENDELDPPIAKDQERRRGMRERRAPKALTDFVLF
ncbi:hypothetical protein V6N11_028688 [Hibiscus sabdariffa]|uniref:U6 snRNA phosphodiesterase 1 n=1 Tax=Hibiscus sabdariffa TaxID=183260 RepID=A0ABR2PQK8_9ROSI